MCKSFKPLVIEIEDDNIEAFRSAELPNDIYVSFKWLYEGKKCGRVFYINGAEFQIGKDYGAAYKISNQVTSLLSRYFARIFKLDNSNHIGHKTRDLVATKINDLYKGE